MNFQTGIKNRAIRPKHRYQQSQPTLWPDASGAPKEVYDLAKAGIIERGSGRLYPLEDSVRRYCDHIRRQTK